MDGVFFDGWGVLLRTGVVGVLAYAGLIVLLRLSGKRTLSKMNAFDFVVTVALGSTLATILLNTNVPFASSRRTARSASSGAAAEPAPRAWPMCGGRGI